MKKKMTALVLALAMMLSLTQGAFAAEPEEITEEQIQAEIQARTEEVYNLVYAQLEAQNAVHMIDDFMEIFAPEIEFEIMQKYNQVVPYSVNATQKYYFPHGGMVAYETLDGRHIVETYYTAADTANYILSVPSFRVYDLLLIIIGKIPKLDNVSIAMTLLDIFINELIKNEIRAADSYSQVIEIEDPDLGFVSAARGWTSHDMSIAYNWDTCQNVQTEFFPEH